MFRHKWYRIIILCLIFIFSASACAGAEPTETFGNKDEITVSFLSDCGAIEGTNTFTLRCGDALKVSLTVKDGYGLIGSDTPECAIVGSVGSVSAIIEKVRYSLRIKLDFERIAEAVAAQIKSMF